MIVNRSYKRIKEIVCQLANYCHNNLQIWLNRENIDKFLKEYPEEERLKILKELKIARKNYLMIKDKPLLIDERILLQEANVGGKLGISSQITELSEKYDIPTSTLLNILKDFGSFEKFKSEYQKYLIGKEKVENEILLKKYIEKLGGKLVSIFDINSPDFIYRNNEYAKLHDIKYQIIDSERLKKEMNRRLKILTARETSKRKYTVFSELEENIFKRFFGLSVKKQTLEEITKDLKLPELEVSNALKSAIKKYRRLENQESIIQFINPDEREKFIKNFFKKYGVFYCDEYEKIEETSQTEEWYGSLFEDEETMNTEWINSDVNKRYLPEMIYATRNTSFSNIELGIEENDDYYRMLRKFLYPTVKTDEFLHKKEEIAKRKVDTRRKNIEIRTLKEEEIAKKVKNRIIQKLEHIENEIEKIALNKVTEHIGIETIDFKKKTVNRLIESKITNVAELLSKTDKELKGYRRNRNCCD